MRHELRPIFPNRAVLNNVAPVQIRNTANPISVRSGTNRITRMLLSLAMMIPRLIRRDGGLGEFLTNVWAKPSSASLHIWAY
jgi:hypothetical protein